MASDLNKSILIGRLVRDCELRHTPAGTSVADFILAVNHSYSVNGERKEEVSFIKCTAWGKAGEIIAEYAKKGHRLGIDGRLKQHSWDDQDGKKRSSIEVVVDTFQFLQPKIGESKQDEGLGTETTGKGFEESGFDPDVPF